MIDYFFSVLLFTGGTILAFCGNASELSLWFLGLGWVLEVTLIGLAWLGSGALKTWSRLSKSTRWMHGLALAAFPVLLASRFLGQITNFKVLLAVSSCFWLISFAALIIQVQKERSAQNG